MRTKLLPSSFHGKIFWIFFHPGAARGSSDTEPEMIIDSQFGSFSQSTKSVTENPLIFKLFQNKKGGEGVACLVRA